MGLFNRKSQSIPVDELTDEQIKKALKKGKAPMLSAKELKKMRQDEIRATLGERGLGALRAAAEDVRRQKENQFLAQMSKDHAVERMKATDPKRYKQLLDQEARRQGLL